MKYGKMIKYRLQKKDVDLGIKDPRGSPTVVNLWLETGVIHLRKLYAQ